MKSTAVKKVPYRQRPFLPYPNAATRQEVLQKIVEVLLMGAIGIGCAATFLLMMVLV